MPGGTDGRQQGRGRGKRPRRRPGPGADPLPALWGMERSEADRQCRECGSSLHRKCENPACSGGPMPIDAKACPNCGLPIDQRGQVPDPPGGWPMSSSRRVATRRRSRSARPPDRSWRGRRSRSGSPASPGSGCSRRRPEPRPPRKAWTAVGATLKELAQTRPEDHGHGRSGPSKRSRSTSPRRLRRLRASPPRHAASRRGKGLSGDPSPLVRLRGGFPEAPTALRRVSRPNATPRRALQSPASSWRSDRADADLEGHGRCGSNPLPGRPRSARPSARWPSGNTSPPLRESRLYAAERAAPDAREAGRPRPSPRRQPTTSAARLAEVQRELSELAAGGRRRGEERCAPRPLSRSSEALPRLPRGPTCDSRACQSNRRAHPRVLSIRREGNRRVLSWRPAAAGRRPTSYVRPTVDHSGRASRQVDPPVPDDLRRGRLVFSDDEVAHGGVILRYMVHAVARGRIEVEGTTIRTFETVSRPSDFRWRLDLARGDEPPEYPTRSCAGADLVRPAGCPASSDRAVAGWPERLRPRRGEPAGDRRGASPRRWPRREDGSHLPNLVPLRWARRGIPDARCLPHRWDLQLVPADARRPAESRCLS